MPKTVLPFPCLAWDDFLCLCSDSPILQKFRHQSFLLRQFVYSNQYWHTVRWSHCQQWCSVLPWGVDSETANKNYMCMHNKKFVKNHIPNRKVIWRMQQCCKFLSVKTVKNTIKYMCMLVQIHMYCKPQS